MPVALRPLCLALVVIAAATPAAAHKRFAKELGVKCRECHTSPEGGGPRTLLGQYHQATGTLPVDRSPATMRLVQDTVDRWMLEVLSAPPTIRYRRPPPPSVTSSGAPAPAWAVLRRLTFDLRSEPPTEADLAGLEAGRPLAAFVDDALASEAFKTTFLRYHKDLVRPRTGIFEPPVSFSRLESTRVGLRRALVSARHVGVDGACDTVVELAPWWDRDHPVRVCGSSASTDAFVVVDGVTLDCGSEAGQASGRCGCGPHLVHCAVDSIKARVVASMEDELPRQAMAIVEQDRPYSEVLTADWTMLDGALEVSYGMVWGTQSTLIDADIRRPWRRVERHPRHSGGLSSPAFLNFFYNGRRWAQRVFETWLCHETTPDYDLLDEVADAGGATAVAYRDSPDQMPTLAVTEGRACAACHLQLDGLARAKDRWDPHGRYHERMPGRDLPIPDEVIFEGRVVAGIDGLGAAIASSPAFSSCVVEQTFQHFLGRRPAAQEREAARALESDFVASGMRFKGLVRALALSPTYAAVDAVKMLKREQLERAMATVTGVPWRVAGRGTAVNRAAVPVVLDDVAPGPPTAGDRLSAAVWGEISGWDLFYDKVGGLDYRRIEQRDLRPSTGYALVQHQAAAASCEGLIDHEHRTPRAGRRWLTMVDDLDGVAPPEVLDAALARLVAKAWTRPWSAVDDAERQALRGLYHRVHGDEPGAAYTAVCTAVLGSTAFSLY